MARLHIITTRFHDAYDTFRDNLLLEMFEAGSKRANNIGSARNEEVVRHPEQSCYNKALFRNEHRVSMGIWKR